MKSLLVMTNSMACLLYNVLNKSLDNLKGRQCYENRDDHRQQSQGSNQYRFGKSFGGAIEAVVRGSKPVQSV
ncbi:hypothetical protein D3C76_1785300 [compost metagenome]